jgi:hypothetical protein
MYLSVSMIMIHTACGMKWQASWITGNATGTC